MNIDNSKGILPNINAWIAHPFNTSGSAFNWILFVGLLVVAAWFWQYTLLQIIGRVESV